MTTATTQDRPQPLQALDVANATRLQIAATRRELKKLSGEEGRERVVELLDRPDRVIGAIRVGQLLRMPQGMGVAQAEKILSKSRISAHRRLRDLTVRERSELSRLLERGERPEDAPEASYRRQPRRRQPAHLDIAPFRAWLFCVLREFDGNRGRLADALGTAERRVYSWLYESSVIQVGVADRALCHIGRPDLLAEFWPALYEFDDGEQVAA